MEQISFPKQSNIDKMEYKSFLKTLNSQEKQYLESTRKMIEVYTRKVGGVCK